MNQEIVSKSNLIFEQNSFCIDSVECNKFSKPTINSSRRCKQKMEELQSTKPCSQDILIPTKFKTKLNFGVNQKVFKPLNSINVNDVLLEKSYPKKYVACSNKIPTPVLHDFLNVVATNTYIVEEPQLNLCSPEYEFDVMAYIQNFDK